MMLAVPSKIAFAHADRHSIPACASD